MLKNVSHPALILSVLVLFVLFEVLFQGILIPRFLELSNGTNLLDMTLFYSPKQAYEMIGNYNSGGRSYYNIIQLTDLFFPLVYSLLLAGILYRLMKALNMARKKWQFLLLLPLLTGLFDWLENLGIFAMLRIFPDRFDSIAILTNLACILKFAGIGLSFLLILTLVGVYIVGN